MVLPDIKLFLSCNDLLLPSANFQEAVSHKTALVFVYKDAFDCSNRDTLLFVLSYEGGIILRIYKGI